MLHHRRDVSKTVVGPAEAVIATAPQEQHQGLRVAIGAIKVSQRIERESEGVDLTIGELLDPRAVQTNAVGVSADDLDMAAVLPFDGCCVVVPVGCVEPAVEASPKSVVEAVGVAFVAKWTVENLPLVGLVVAVGVFKVVDIRDAKCDDAVFIGIKPYGDVESVGEDDRLLSPAVVIGVDEDSDRVFSFAIERSRERILFGTAHPKPAPGVECKVHRLLDLGFGGKELDFEAGRQTKRLRFIRGR